jgi:hypothetical protein
MRKLAPPGRKGSTKKESFKGDGLVDAIDFQKEEEVLKAKYEGFFLIKF